MADTAIPMPDNANDTIPEQSTLTHAQRQRVEALSVAKNIAIVGSGLWGKNNAPQVTIGELTYLAEWILSGGDSDEDETPQEIEPETLPNGLERVATFRPSEPAPGFGSHDPIDGGYLPEQDDVLTQPIPVFIPDETCGATKILGGRRLECVIEPPGHEGDCDFTKDTGRVLADNPQA